MPSNPRQKIALALLACSDAQIATALDPAFQGEHKLLTCALTILAVADDYQAAADFDADTAISFAHKIVEANLTNRTR
jgi:hypothetical protein